MQNYLNAFNVFLSVTVSQYQRQRIWSRLHRAREPVAAYHSITRAITVCSKYLKTNTRNQQRRKEGKGKIRETSTSHPIYLRRQEIYKLIAMIRASKSLTKNVKDDICLPIWYKPLIRSDNTSIGRVCCISSSFNCECCSLRVGTVSPWRYNVVASWQCSNISSIFSPNNSVQLSGDSRNYTRDGCFQSGFNFLT